MDQVNPISVSFFYPNSYCSGFCLFVFLCFVIILLFFYNHKNKLHWLCTLQMAATILTCRFIFKKTYWLIGVNATNLIKILKYVSRLVLVLGVKYGSGESDLSVVFLSKFLLFGLLFVCFPLLCDYIVVFLCMVIFKKTYWLIGVNATNLIKILKYVSRHFRDNMPYKLMLKCWKC
jgi:uncharacterized membrane protein YbhN (UPF0104 family)